MMGVPTVTESDRLPHRFTPEQVDVLAAIIGDNMAFPEARSINAEIGVAPTRSLLSDVQTRVLDVVDGPRDRIVLMLSAEECEALVNMGIPEDIRREIGHVVP